MTNGQGDRVPAVPGRDAGATETSRAHARCTGRLAPHTHLKQNIHKTRSARYARCVGEGSRDEGTCGQSRLQIDFH